MVKNEIIIITTEKIHSKMQKIFTVSGRYLLYGIVCNCIERFESK